MTTFMMPPTLTLTGGLRENMGGSSIHQDNEVNSFITSRTPEVQQYKHTYTQSTHTYTHTIYTHMKAGKLNAECVSAGIDLKDTS